MGKHKDYVVEQVGAFAYVRKLKELLDLLSSSCSYKLAAEKIDALLGMEKEIIKIVKRQVDDARRGIYRRCVHEEACKKKATEKGMSMNEYCNKAYCLGFYPVEDLDGKEVKAE